ncbi:hypothetical protein [Frondihabitans sp. VKM Ac-2883]|uniref:hypothetical protein n=1 Tax=Frondihabitans sp. VKM Ac-2883 TaxID=2783823 RepID=UPI001889DA0B|nr:hypothetical protein [Frondihabitans sp. VKM Ac-2883]MBF4577848.1 hypothetical protein [Frondihabitans sp. VKM Ac-2883]
MELPNQGDTTSGTVQATYGESMFRCGSFHLHEEVAYQCLWDTHPDTEPHMAVIRTPGTMRGGDIERWGLLLWTNDMAYRGHTT